MKNDQNTTIEEYKEYFNNFCKARKWDKQTPRELILSLLIELGELAEFYQWEDQYSKVTEKKEKVAEEVVDIFNYLLLLAKRLNIDISKSGFKKFEKLSEKYPISEFEGTLGRENYYKRKAEYRRRGIN